MAPRLTLDIAGGVLKDSEDSDPLKDTSALVGADGAPEVLEPRLFPPREPLL